MIPVCELMKWGHNASDKWCSTLNVQLLAYCWLLPLLLPFLLHTGYIALFWPQLVYQWIYIEIII
jgi:hypothetical protein